MKSVQEQLDEIRAKCDAEREELSKKRQEREASLEAKSRENKIQIVMSQRNDFSRRDAEMYVYSGLYDQALNQPIPDYIVSLRQRGRAYMIFTPTPRCRKDTFIELPLDALAITMRNHITYTLKGYCYA